MSCPTPTTQPIAGADVQLTVGANEISMSGETTSDGAFAFATPGATKDATAAVTVTKKGYQATQASLGAAPGSAEPLCLPPTR
jgi:uncharacterized protein YfaS (alpha-2-macroglobulin family)